MNHDWHLRLADASVWFYPAFVDHLWQATLVGLLVLVASFTITSRPARTRHLFWLLAAIKFALPSALIAFLATRLGVDQLLGPMPSQLGLLTGIAEPAAVLATVVVSANEGSHKEIYCALILIWLVGCVTLLLGWGRRRIQLHRILRKPTSVTHGLEWEALQRMRKTLSLEQKVRLLISPERTEPGVCGMRSPVIILPQAITTQLDTNELEAILLHELIHVQRRDNLIGTLQIALTAIFWFHPLIWVIGRKLSDEREQACDERVLELLGAPEVYAAGILKVVRFSFGWKIAGVAGAGSGSNLRRRVENIMLVQRRSGKVGIAPRLLFTGVVTVALALMIASGLYARARSEAEVATHIFATETQQQLSQSPSAPNAPPAPDSPPAPPSPANDENPVQPPAPPQPAQPPQPPASNPPAQPVNPTQPANIPAQPSVVAPSTPPTPPTQPAPPRNQEKVTKGKLIEAPKPVYPEEAKKQKVEGVVQVNIVIGEDGNVISARPTAGPEMLQGAARDAAMKARFEPTVVGGKTVKVSGTMSYSFVLDEKEKTD